MKDDERYGLGKAIGDKAAHLFAKWYVHCFELAKRKDDTWGNRDTTCECRKSIFRFGQDKRF